jgi:hypothetical protein
MGSTSHPENSIVVAGRRKAPKSDKQHLLLTAKPFPGDIMILMDQFSLRSDATDVSSSSPIDLSSLQSDATDVSSSSRPIYNSLTPHWRQVFGVHPAIVTFTLASPLAR